MVYSEHYDWRVNKYPISADVAGKRIEELEQENGEVNPQILLDDSRPEDAVMHCCFEWRDDIAAERYRLEQSRDLLGNLRIVRIEEEEPDSEPVKLRAFHSVSETRSSRGEFHHIDVIKANEDMSRNVINNAKTELEIFYNKYCGLCDVCGIMEEFILKKKGGKR